MIYVLLTFQTICLILGVFDADDMKQLLILIDPATFDGNYRKGKQEVFLQML